MSKGLEALEDLRFQVGNIHYFTKDLKQTTREVRDSGLFEIIEKELKALEIIVKKANIRLWENHGNYYFTTTNNVYGISKEKYDLLKEVLL